MLEDNQNPELANVAANTQSQPPVSPVSAPAASASKPVVPTKIGKESNKKKSNTHFLLGCGGGLLLLFVFFLILMVFVMAQGGGNNAVIASFGLAPGAIRNFLLGVINLSFGFLSLLFFVLMVIGIFKLSFAKKDDKPARKKGVKMIVFSLIPFFVLLTIWFLLYGFISRLQITAERVVAEILVLEPQDLTALSAPVEVTFSAINVKKALGQSRLAVASATWDLDGDGNFETPMPSTGQVTRLYQQRGVYNVGLQVFVIGEEQARIYNLPLNVSEALFGAQPAFGLAPLDVQFDASGLLPKGFKLESLDWDFDGDGVYDVSGSDQLKPQFTFTKIGTYTVRLRVIDQNSTVENYTREIEVTPSSSPLLQSKIKTTPGASGAVPFSVLFDGSDSVSLKGNVVSYEWDFGDGSALQSGKTVDHIYQQPGFYDAVLMVKDDKGNAAQNTLTIEVTGASSLPNAVIETTPLSSSQELSGELPFKVQFDASNSTDSDDDIVEYEWDFDGDGKIDMNGQKGEFTFESAGSFTAVLIVRDSQGHSASDMLTITVQEPGVKAVLDASPQEGTVPLTVQFDGSGSSAFEAQVVSYEWDFGDGSPKSITGATVNHKYDKVGTYTATLTVQTNASEKATTTKQIFVREIPLAACFQPSRTSGSAPLSVTFDSKCSTGAIDQFSWDFGDGVESSSIKPAHTFENPGTYTVTLEVLDDKNNVHTYTDVIVVEGQIK